jgi:hypothetical protein
MVGVRGRRPQPRVQRPTRYLLCRDDCMFTAAWARRGARERFGLQADEMNGGHYVTLSRPRELAERLDAYAAASRTPLRRRELCDGSVITAARDRKATWPCR